MSVTPQNPAKTPPLNYASDSGNRHGSMAIVKLKYTRSRDGMKRHLRYIVHRPGKEQEKLTREIFHHNYLSVTKQYAYDLINTAPKGTVFYKMTINFHPVKEDTHKDLDLHAITSLTVREMQLRLGRSVLFIATIHEGHANTELRHIHAICLVQGRVSKEDFGVRGASGGKYTVRE